MLPTVRCPQHFPDIFTVGIAGLMLHGVDPSDCVCSSVLSVSDPRYLCQYPQNPIQYPLLVYHNLFDTDVYFFFAAGRKEKEG